MHTSLRRIHLSATRAADPVYFLPPNAWPVPALPPSRVGMAPCNPPGDLQHCIADGPLFSARGAPMPTVWRSTCRNRRSADDEQILAVPTAVRKLPPPVRKLIANLSGSAKVLVGLDMR